ncbi:DinB family protein [Streptomyces sp. NPDC006283]|uniref:DinB family protein n=1 Tax=Streptomyces sp. NPDC006283 TaxID=3156741 RepID=UPI0033A857AA
MIVMTTDVRTEPSTTASELDMLTGFLDYHRETLIMKCEGLDDAQLRTPSLAPSGLTLMGLVRHLAEVERYWFREIMDDEDLPDLYSTEQDHDGDFHVTDQDTWAEAHATWLAQVTDARKVTASHGLDDVSASLSRGGKRFSLRWILTHMIEEYARHNGHADLLREHIDGATGE